MRRRRRARDPYRGGFRLVFDMPDDRIFSYPIPDVIAHAFDTAGRMKVSIS